MSYILAFKRKGTETPSGSDLVALGILPKQISEFTNADIGTEVSIPYTDAGGVISGPIVFKVVGVNHHKDTNNADTPTITLMTKNVIRSAAFDAKEPNNPLIDEEWFGERARANWGNNRWSVSNIRQWLNSSGAANSWFTKQHEYDEAPTTDKVFNEDFDGSIGAFADEPGFLAGFSAEVLQHFTDITNTTAIPKPDGGGSETTVDKVFLPSYTEMGFGTNNGIAEGAPLSVSDSIIKSGADGYYWMRSPTTNDSCDLRKINEAGINLQGHAYDSRDRYSPNYSSSLI